MDALIVVDMQEAGIANGRQHDVAGVVRRIDQLALRVRRSGGVVIFVQHDGAAGHRFEPNTAGWEVASALTVDSRDRRVRKTVNDAFHRTPLESMLRDLAVDRVIICGWATDFCVDSTVRSAVARGFDVIVASDCHTVDDRPHLGAQAIIEHHNWVWANLTAPGSVRVVPEESIQVR